MSVWYSLACGCCGATLRMPESIEEGGTYIVGGTSECELNVTYNYGKQYATVLDGYEGMLAWLRDRDAKETIPELRKVVETLGTDRDSNYWEATPGNAGHAASILLSFAEQHPEGVWRASG